MSLFDADKKVIIIGDRDGIPDQPWKNVKTTDAEVVSHLLSVLSERLQGYGLRKPKEVKDLTENTVQKI